MCTVTFVPKGDNDFILTSNRDEAIGRKTLPPEFYFIDRTRMLFPGDAVAGGTWMGLSDKSRMICLLNGGFEPHLRKESYKISRGVVVKELLSETHLERALKDYDYNGVEPFTIVALDWSSRLKLFELVWEGASYHLRQLPLSEYIWSSSTLYTKTMKAKRESWFEDFLQGETVTPSSILHFHKTAGENNPDTNLIMDRGFLKTVSISQIEKSGENCTFDYYDLMEGDVYKSSFEIQAV